jgi:hypothetical protein
MPSKSKSQHNLMAMVAHDPKAAKRLDIPQSVGRDYVEADKGRKFGSGGTMKESKAMMRKEVSFMKKKGAPKSMIKHEEAEMEGKKMRKFAGGGYAALQAKQAATRAREAAFRQANSVEARAAAQRAARAAPPPTPPAKPSGIGSMPGASGGQANAQLEALRNRASAAPSGGMGGAGGNMAMMRKGGSVKKYARGGGIEIKGKTRGKMVKMAGGGKC